MSNNLTDLYLTHPKHATQRFLTILVRCIQFSNSFHIPPGQMTIWVGLTSTHKSFFYSISRVISACTNPQMLGIYTNFVIARMAQHHPFWDFTFVQFIRKTMRSYLVIPFFREITISITRSTALPIPTIISLLYKLPEPNFRLNFNSLIPRTNSFLKTHTYMLPHLNNV